MLIKPRCCPHCYGALCLDSDRYGWYWQCANCARIYDLPINKT